MIYLLAFLAYVLANDAEMEAYLACFMGQDCAGIMATCGHLIADESAIQECVQDEMSQEKLAENPGNMDCAMCFANVDGEHGGGNGDNDSDNDDDFSEPPNAEATAAINTCLSGAKCANGAYEASCNDLDLEFTQETWLPFAMCVLGQAEGHQDDGCSSCLETAYDSHMGGGGGNNKKKKNSAPALFSVVGTLLALVSSLL